MKKIPTLTESATPPEPGLCASKKPNLVLTMDRSKWLDSSKVVEKFKHLNEKIDVYLAEDYRKPDQGAQRGLFPLLTPSPLGGQAHIQGFYALYMSLLLESECEGIHILCCHHPRGL